MSNPRDFDELRAAWNAIEPSAPEAEAVLDTRTRATIDWLKAAYEHLEPPSPVIPTWVQPRARRPRVVRLLRLTRALAAAAAILALAFGARALLAGGEGGAPRSTEHASIADGHEAPAQIREAPIEPSAPAVHASFRTDGIELRSGKVRLILLDARRKEPTNTPTENLTDQENAR